MRTLTGQFLVGYTTTKPRGGKFRRIKIEPTLRDSKLRHRGGHLDVPPA